MTNVESHKLLNVMFIVCGALVVVKGLPHKHAVTHGYGNQCPSISVCHN